MESHIESAVSEDHRYRHTYTFLFVNTFFRLIFFKFEVGCLADDDSEGLNYDGPADRDSRGRPCIPWNLAGLDDSNPASTWVHNQCRCVYIVR